MALVTEYCARGECSVCDNPMCEHGCHWCYPDNCPGNICGGPHVKAVISGQEMIYKIVPGSSGIFDAIISRKEPHDPLTRDPKGR